MKDTPWRFKGIELDLYNSGFAHPGFSFIFIHSQSSPIKKNLRLVTDKATVIELELANYDLTARISITHQTYNSNPPSYTLRELLRFRDAWVTTSRYSPCLFRDILVLAGRRYC